MLRTIIGKVVWLTKGAALFGGAVVTLALVLGVASMALGANGRSFILGKNNAATAITRLTGNVQGPAMRVVNNNPGADDTGLNLTVQSGEAPMRVTSDTKVSNLNADKLDGLDSANLVTTNTTAFVRSSIYKRESNIDVGTQIGDGTFVKTHSCPGGAIMLSGGPANVEKTSTLLESFPAPSSLTSWQARIDSNGTADPFSVVVHCANPSDD